MEKLKTVKFAHQGTDGFYETVVKRVHAYFRTNKISPYANSTMWLKTIIMISLYFVPYIFMVTGFAADNAWVFFGLWFLMGWGMVGIGTSVMHDAHHGTYSANKNVNKLMGSILEIIGGYTVTWKIQHNVLHHTYTNVAGLDDDLDSISLLRFSPSHPRQWFHKYQYLYAWFFYMNMTLFWMTAKDFIQVVRYKQHDLLVRQHLPLGRALLLISLYKIFYYSYIIVLPILFSGMPWYYIVLGFLLMHFTAGIFLSCIFQPSHIVENSKFAEPTAASNKKEMEDSWAIHEVANTTDFAPNKPFFSWFIGGLNYQIEHHLFTGINHVHYKNLAPIVAATAKEFNIPYNVQPTFRKALGDHVRMLIKLGKK